LEGGSLVISRLEALVLCLLALTAVPAAADPGGGGGYGGEGSQEQVNPEARSLYDYGLSLMRQKRWPQAIQAFSQAVRLSPTYAEAWNNLGYCHRRNKENNRALDAYQQALRIRPDYAPAHEYIGRLYVALGNRSMAMQHYETLRRLDVRLAAQLLRAIEANNAELGEDG
jgi:tetratricopeptide (TPR) repeat protein